MEKILISACLLGENVRYDGKNSQVAHPVMEKWAQEDRLVPICPEMAGGLPVPRPPCEQNRKTGRMQDQHGTDHTQSFLNGAQAALDMARRGKINWALLKECSPSCGSSEIYDGSFSSVRIRGEGLTTELLRQHGIQVFSENEIDQLAQMISQQEQRP